MVNNRRSSNPLDIALDLFGEASLAALRDRTAAFMDQGPTWTSTRTTTTTPKNAEEDSDNSLLNIASSLCGTFMAVCDMPGVSKDTLTVTVSKSRIKAVGVREDKTTSTLQTQTYTRVWEFPNVDPASVKASIKHGVLTVDAREIQPPEAEEFKVQVD